MRSVITLIALVLSLLGCASRTVVTGHSEVVTAADRSRSQASNPVSVVVEQIEVSGGQVSAQVRVRNESNQPIRVSSYVLFGLVRCAYLRDGDLEFRFADDPGVLSCPGPLNTDMRVIAAGGEEVVTTGLNCVGFTTTASGIVPHPSTLKVRLVDSLAVSDADLKNLRDLAIDSSGTASVRYR